MDDLCIPATASSPSVSAIWDTGLVQLAGDSYPENSYELFAPLIAWLERYLLREDDQPLKLELGLLYLNTSSVKSMMDIFDLLEEAHRGGRTLQVTWHYSPRNERVAELAEEFREDCSFPFAITPLNGN
ncbi:biofilm regulation phosphoprotein SiaC [Halotalea alkalilenta]|uniref:biofilm regulation phosphoprotein SiaC n=1 Tax=Halotalea alkalilenta TaxID=376489 RepID=UPI00047FE884|nr:biofilm regulation phosphoprotein SiaC [Halotalea alkalilenta]